MNRAMQRDILEAKVKWMEEGSSLGEFQSADAAKASMSSNRPSTT
jgi:hypothetical protein